MKNEFNNSKINQVNNSEGNMNFINNNNVKNCDIKSEIGKESIIERIWNWICGLFK